MKISSFRSLAVLALALAFFAIASPRCVGAARKRFLGLFRVEAACAYEDDDTSGACRDLRKGYDLLGKILGVEGSMWLLPIVRVLTFSARPVSELRQFATKISQTGNKRKKELKELRKLSPDVSDKFVNENPDDDPMVKAIGEVMTWKIIGDMTDRGRKFDLNFAMLQIVATRVIAATAKALIPFEKNEKREAWLKEVSDEYQSLRQELRGVIEKYIEGKGADSLPRDK